MKNYTIRSPVDFQRDRHADERTGGTLNDPAVALRGRKRDRVVVQRLSARSAGPTAGSWHVKETVATVEASLAVDVELARDTGPSATVTLTATPLIDGPGSVSARCW